MAQSTVKKIGNFSYRFDYPTVATRVAIASTKAILTRGSENILQFSDPETADYLDKLALIRSLVSRLDAEGNVDFTWDVIQLEEEDAGIVDEIYSAYTKWRDDFRKARTTDSSKSAKSVSGQGNNVQTA